MDIFKLLNLRAFKDMASICQPLANVNSTIFFKYCKVYQDGSFTCLSNQIPWIKHYFKKHLYKNSAYIGHPLLHTPKLLFSDNMTCSKSIVREASHGYNINKTMMLIKPYKNFEEVYLFGSSNQSSSVFEYYINNMDFFEKYIFYFKEKAIKLLETAPRIRVNNEQSLGIFNNENINNQLPVLKMQRYYLPGEFNQYLTSREVQCVTWMVQGKSMEEIACIINASKRTVESHINSVKNKLNCYKQTSLIYKLIDLGIVK